MKKRLLLACLFGTWSAGAVSAQVVVSDSNYTITRSTGAAYTPINLTGTSLTPAPVSGTNFDDNLYPVTLTSPFTYYGTAYSTCSVSINGNIAFGGTQPTGAAGYTNTALSASAPTLPTINPYWDDLYFFGSNATSGLFSQTTGAVTTIEWNQVGYFNQTSTSTLTFQVQLDSATGTITMQYQDVSGPTGFSNGASATIGLKGPSSFVQVSANFAGVTAGDTLTAVTPPTSPPVSPPPPPPPPPITVPTNIDLGPIVQNSHDGTTTATYASSATSLTTANAHTAGQIRWYKITIPYTISNSIGNYFDIHVAGTGITDTEIGLYRVDGTLVATDDDDGVGSGSSLSFGRTTTHGTIGNSVASNGRDGTLLAGDYYLAVAGFNAAFASTSFGVTTTSAVSGTITVDFRTVPEPWLMGFAGSALGIFALRRKSPQSV